MAAKAIIYQAHVDVVAIIPSKVRAYQSHIESTGIMLSKVRAYQSHIELLRQSEVCDCPSVGANVMFFGMVGL